MTTVLPRVNVVANATPYIKKFKEKIWDDGLKSADILYQAQLERLNKHNSNWNLLKIL